MQIVGLVNGNSNNADFQFQTAPTSFINQGVISGLAVTLNQVAVGSALISVTSNGQTWLITFHNTSLVTIDTSGTKKVWIEVTQAKIDNGVSNNEDGTGIAFINTGASYPGSGSYIPLASIASGVITDDRVFISMKAIKRKAMTANGLLYIDASGNEQELPYGTSGQVLTAVNGTTTPIWNSPSLDIHSLTQKTTPIGADEVIITDSEASFVNKNITLGNLFSFFGDGSDGSITISTNTTLTRDMYYINLTINNTIVLNPNGFRIYVSGTLTNNGIISRDGNAGQNGILNNVQVVLSASGGAELNIGNLGGSIAGGASDIAGSNQSPTYISQSGANGGRSHNSATTPLGGTSTIGAQRNLVISPYNISFIGHIASNGFTRYVASAGSAGGLSDSNGTLGKAVSGGGGGGTGGPIYIAASTINNSSGIIRSNGGVGGNGNSSSTNTSPFIASGGGGGGAGGPIIIIYKSISAGTIQSNGGVGGTKTAGLQNGSAILSTDGAVGPNGFILQYQVV